MQFYEGSSSSVGLFLLIVCLVIGFFVFSQFKLDRTKVKNVFWFLFAWNGITSLIVLSKLVQEHFIPIGPLLFLSVNISVLAFSFSELGNSYLKLANWKLLLFQSFRLPLELVIHNWTLSKTMPETMTWTGQNFDILTGVLALGVLRPGLRNKKYIWFVNVVGILLLINVLRVVIMSSPLPFAWQVENPIQLIAFFPYHLIGTVCVWAAAVGHIILTRNLLRANPKATLAVQNSSS